MVEAVSTGEGMFESILVFYPVDSQEDDGVHTCDMTINSNTMLAEDNFIEGTTKQWKYRYGGWRLVAKYSIGENFCEIYISRIWS